MLRKCVVNSAGMHPKVVRPSLQEGRMKTLLIAAMVFLPLAFPAQAFTAKNGMTIIKINATDFRVMFDSVPRETDYLCAAGDFLISGLGLPSKTRLYRASSGPPRNGKGISFTTDPARKVNMALFTSFSAQQGDGGISAGAATGAYCEMIPWFPFN